MQFNVNNVRSPLVALTAIRQIDDDGIQCVGTVDGRAQNEIELFDALRGAIMGEVTLEGTRLFPLRHVVPMVGRPLKLAGLSKLMLPTARRGDSPPWRLSALSQIQFQRQEPSLRAWDSGTIADVVSRLVGPIARPARERLAKAKIEGRYPLLQQGADRPWACHLLRQAHLAGFVGDVPIISAAPTGPVIELAPDEGVDDPERVIELPSLRGRVKRSFYSDNPDLPLGLRIVVENRPFNCASVRAWLSRTVPKVVTGEQGIVTSIVDHFKIDETGVEWSSELVLGAAPTAVDCPPFEVHGRAVVVADELQEPWCRIRLPNPEKAEIWALKTQNDPAAFPKLPVDTVIAFSWSGVLGDAVRVGPCDQVASPFPTPCFDYRGETVHETATKKHVHGAYQVQADEVAIRAGSKASIHGSGSGAIFADTCIMEL